MVCMRASRGVDAPEDEVRRHRSRPVEGLRALVLGHLVVDEVEQIGNRWNIDTGASFPDRNRLTLVQINSRAIEWWTFVVDDSDGDGARSPGAGAP